MNSTNPVVANALAAHGAVVKNALTVVEQRQNDVEWKKFEEEVKKVFAESVIIKKELKDAENMVAACYAKIKPIFDKAIKFGHDKHDICRVPRLFVSDKLFEDDRYQKRIVEIDKRLTKEVVEAIIHQGDDARMKAYDIINIPRPFYN